MPNCCRQHVTQAGRGTASSCCHGPVLTPGHPPGCPRLSALDSSNVSDSPPSHPCSCCCHSLSVTHVRISWKVRSAVSLSSSCDSSAFSLSEVLCRLLSDSRSCRPSGSPLALRSLLPLSLLRSAPGPGPGRCCGGCGAASGFGRESALGPGCCCPGGGAVAAAAAAAGGAGGDAGFAGSAAAAASVTGWAS